MRTSLKLGLLLAASGSIAFAGCSTTGGDDSSSSAGTTALGGTSSSSAGHAGTASGGTGISVGGSSAGAGASGTGTGGANAGASGSGTAGAAAGTGGTGAGGSGAGTGGASAGSGGASAGSAGTAGSAGSAGTGGTGGTACADETAGVTGEIGEAGAGGAADSVTTAIVLVDDVVIMDATNTTVVTQWQFADGSTIADTSTARPGDKWSRTAYSSIGATQTPSDTFLACDGNPANGSIKNIIPFTADSQYYQLSVLSAQHDYSGDHVTAKVKLVSGGRPVAACAAGASLYAVNGVTPYAMTPLPPFVVLTAGQWKDIALTIPATGFTTIDELAVQISTYPCN